MLVWKRKIDLLVILAWTLAAFCLSLLYGSNYIITSIFFFVIPSVFLTFKRPTIFKKIFKVSVVFTIPAVGIASYLAHADGAWYNPSLLNIRLLGSYPIEDFFWAFFYFYYILAFYEYFIDGEKILKLPLKFIKFSKIIIPSTIIFSLVAYFKGGIGVNYTYILAILIWFIALPWIIIGYHQRLIPKIVKVGVYFLLLSILYEYVANKNNNWFFPGNNFVGYVSVLDIKFPLEEFLWLFFAVPAIVTYYEFLADDEK